MTRTTEREVSADIPIRLLAYVRRVCGRPGVDRVLAEVGEVRPLREVLDQKGWFSFEEVEAIVEAAARVCGDPDLGRRTGEELMRATVQSGMADFLVATGSIEAAFDAVANASTKISTGRTMRVTARSPARITIEGDYRNLQRSSPFYCSLSAGYFSQVPMLFGAAAGAVAEVTCQLRGDARCTFDVVWDDPATADGLEGFVVDGQRRSHLSIARYERLQELAAELAQAEDIETVLTTITDGAGTALNAPKYLLAVRLDGGRGDDDLHIHHRGFSEPAARAYAERLLADQITPDSSVLCVPVASSKRDYGRLVACFPLLAEVTSYDRRLLTAYAGHAVSALERVESLEAARRDRDTAQALLELAQALSAVGTTAEVAGRLARAVPRATGCDEVGVWLYDADDDSLSNAAQQDAAGTDLGTASAKVSVPAFPSLAGVVRAPGPFLLDVRSASPGIVAAVRLTGLSHVAVVPIFARGEFLGFVGASFLRPPQRTTQARLLRVLGGLADLSGAAFDNARLLERVRHQAMHDGLTGLPNRPLLEDRATIALRHAERNGNGCALLFVDLDRFKNVNDTLGHQAGDDLIRQVTQRLLDGVRSSDTVGRLGGDEFVVVMPDIDDAVVAEELAERLVLRLSEPFMVSGHELFISCSIGIATSPEHGTDYQSLLDHADIAMFEAKASGRSTFRVSARREASERRDLLDLESALHRAVEKDELRVLYQPQIDLTTMRVVGVEALVRWQHPTAGLVGPDVFVPLAEESGLIVGIDRWVRSQAFAQAKAWSDAGMPLRMSVNLSTREVRDPHLADHIGAAMEAVGLDPGLVELEITDRVVMSEGDLPDRLHALKALGVRIAIDDFGTGNSVLGRLQRCPVDTLKIDRSFVREIDDVGADAPVVAALVAMAHRLDLSVVVEGVETARQGAALRSLGCHLAQGFYFSRPVEASAVEDLARSASR